jgi:hypothetical protein
VLAREWVGKFGRSLLMLVNGGVSSRVEGSGFGFETDRVLAVKRTRSV